MKIQMLSDAIQNLDPQATQIIEDSAIALAGVTTEGQRLLQAALGPRYWVYRGGQHYAVHAETGQPIKGQRLALIPDNGEQFPRRVGYADKPRGDGAYAVHAANAYPKLVAALREQIRIGMEVTRTYQTSDYTHDARALLRELGEE